MSNTRPLWSTEIGENINTWHSPFGAMVKWNNKAGICEPTWWGRRDRRQSSAAPVDIQWIPGAPLSSRSPGTHIQEIYTLKKQRDKLRFTTILPVTDVIVSTMERVLFMSLVSSYSGPNKTKLCLLSFKQQALHRSHISHEHTACLMPINSNIKHICALATFLGIIFI